MPRTAALLGLAVTAHALVAPTTPHQRLAPAHAVADLLRDAKLDIPWLAEGDAPAAAAAASEPPAEAPPESLEPLAA